MNLGKIDRIIAIGGGQSLLEFVRLSKSLGIQILVVTSQRQSSEVIFSGNEEKKFIDALSAENFKVYVSNNINNDEKVLSEWSTRKLGGNTHPLIVVVFKTQILSVKDSCISNQT